MNSHVCTAMAGALAILGATPGTGAVTVFGNSDAVLCYEAAEGRRSRISGLDSCDTALKAGGLPREHHVATLVNRGITLMHLGRVDRAISDYQAALKVDPASGEAWVNLGIARWHAGRDSDTALADISRGIEVGTSEPDVAHFMRAVVNEELGNVRAAFEDYTRASELAPEWDLPRRELSRFEVRREN